MSTVEGRDILLLTASEIGIPLEKVRNTVKLLDDQNTIPFIARYRKEVTGELDEEQIRQIYELVKSFRNLEKRKAEVARLIEEQGKLSEDLRCKINGAAKLTEVEDLYQPYRPKRKTRASIAREKGLEPLASYLLSFPRSGNPSEAAVSYLSDAVSTVEEALGGAMDIVAEQVADDAVVRGWVRDYTRKHGWLVSKAKDAGRESVYREMYYDYREPVNKAAPHRILAINRGEREDLLSISVEVEEGPVVGWINKQHVRDGTATTDLVKKAVTDAYRRLIAPSVERDIRNLLTEKAEDRALRVFSENLRSLLLQPPVRGKVLLGVDPAYRTGCKWAVIGETGRLVEVGVVYPTPPHKKIKESEEVFARLVNKYGVNAIVIGNGTASRETEQFVAEFISKLNSPGLSYTIVSEAGASVYSASKLAAKEFPGLDVSERSAVSIARRLQDTLSELVKIEPRSLSVGMYQHDCSSRKLEERLAGVVESAVNYVGVDLNTSSAELLSYISGINCTVAENIVKHRDVIGSFKSRRELSAVPKLGPRTFQQSAGFMRINGGDNPLDATPIHPESYKLTLELLKSIDARTADIGTPVLRTKLAKINVEETAAKLGAGIPTLRHIIESLARPGRDPREDLPPPVFRTDVLDLKDLRPGMELRGTVRNVVDFGAFVDIGVKQDGLVHISELADRRVGHPLDVVSVGDVVTVRVLSVDENRGRVSLSMRGV